MNKMISVIVPVYNVEAYLPRCLDSILAQSYNNLEVILVDDGSADGSGAICDEYAALDSRIRVIHKENGGLSSARNAGIQAATGEFLSFVDSDDWIEPDTYEVMLSIAEKYQVPLVCAGRYDVDGKTGERKIGLCPPKEEKLAAEELVGRIFLWDNCDSSACDKLFSRELFREFRFPEGKVSEDVAVMYRIILGAEGAALCPKPLYNYYHRPGSITKAAVSEKTFHFSQHTAEIYAYIREHHPAILPQARYLRVRSLYHILIRLDKKDQEGVYADRRREALGELRKHTSFVLTGPYFGKQERLTDLLLILGLYGPFQRLYHFLKGRKL